MGEKKDFKFDINASVVFRLGEELITDDGQALLELIKNSYDADASYSSISIDTKAKIGEVLNGHKVLQNFNSYYSDSKGVMIIEDDGCGMNKDEIIKGFLTISASKKGEMKKAGKTTDKKRTPMGDKGLGRLGVQRLGGNVDIYTFPLNNEEDCYHVGFSWKDFKEGSLLSEINVRSETIPRIKKQGTYVVISGLKDLRYWENNQQEFLRKVYSLISPYKDQQDFIFTLNINGENFDLLEITENILDVADIRYDFDLDTNNNFNIVGKIKFNFLKSKKDKKAIEFFNDYLKIDNGKEYRNFLLNDKKAKKYNLNIPEDDKYYLEVKKTINIEDIDKLELFEDKIAFPGFFDGHIFYFNFDDAYNNLTDNKNIFNSKSAFNQIIQRLKGIKVYRDNFGIKVSNDWLNLGRQQTSGKSWYGLRPNNTLGYISLSAKDNDVLKETTNREGFIENPYYNNFYKILQEFVMFTEDLHADIRKIVFKKFKDKKDKKDIKEKTGSSETNPDKIVDDLINITPELPSSGEESNDKPWGFDKNDDRNFSEKLTDVCDDLVPLNLPPKGIMTKLFQVREELKRLEERNKTFNEKIVSTKVKVVKNQLDTLKEERFHLLEASSLGITVESLVHEINTVVGRLYEKTMEIHKRFKSELNPKILLYFEESKSSLNTIRKQLQHLTPSLRYVREMKQDINLQDFWNNELEYYLLRFETKNIKLNLIYKNNFEIKINKGKLFQIFDNLLLNSEYWLLSNVNKNKGNLNIFIEIDKPHIRVWDSGMGVNQSIENLVFDPFVTKKENGRGLGLYIISQFLDLENSSIDLLPERNEFNRKYKFEINFEGCLK